MPNASHAFTSAIADAGDATKVQPSNWNAIHYQTIPDGGGALETDHMALTQRLIAAGTGRLTLREPLMYFRGAYGLGSVQIIDDAYLLQYKRATLNGTARATLSGTGEMFLFDLAPVGRLVLAGRGL